MFEPIICQDFTSFPLLLAQTYQSHSGLRTLALAVPPPPVTVLLDIYIACSSSSFTFSLNYSEEFSLASYTQ